MVQKGFVLICLLCWVGKILYISNLCSGYWQIAMDKNSKEKTAFACQRDLFQFNIMPFGLTNAPAVFQELMLSVLDSFNQFAVAYLDDLLIFSETLEEHLAHIQNVFGRLREHHLKLKLKKCSFLKAETNYLGFVINEFGIKPEACKVNIIKSLPTPKTVEDMRSHPNGKLLSQVHPTVFSHCKTYHCTHTQICKI